MSLTLTKYPVSTVLGKILNVFAGFKPLEIEFERKDSAITSISDSLGKVVVAAIVNSYDVLNVGESVYIYAAGVTHIYDGVYQITSINYTDPTHIELTLTADFFEVASNGYINYKQNYFVESKLVDVVNPDIQIYSNLIEDDGTANGEITLNVNNPVDFLKSEILENSGENIDSRERFQVKYREVYRENQTDVFVLLNEIPLIVVYSADYSDPELFLNGLDSPVIYKGYDFDLSVLHSFDNYQADTLAVFYSELDINNSEIVAAIELHNFTNTEFGQLQVNFGPNSSTLNALAQFVKFELKTKIGGVVLDTKICSIITPDSFIDSRNESYEYFLKWINPDGGVYSRLFTDFEKLQDIKGDIINTKSENITKVFKNSFNSVALIAEDLSENEFDNISNIVRANLITKELKDGTFENRAIGTRKTKKQKSDFRYNFEIEIEEIESNILA